jgi:tetratricopeptide (TPR) repeat protein
MRTGLFMFVVLVLCVTGCSQSTPTAGSGKPPAPATVAAAPAPHAMPSLPGSTAEWARGAQLFEGLGNSHRAITTSSREAQQYFDQGMRLMWGFNHDEATRSFARAAELDPHCASCYWGVALTVGPNYNLPFLSAGRARVAFEARALAEQNAHTATPVEQALIATLAQRYPTPQPLDPAAALPVLKAFAQAMHAVAQRFPQDLDVQTLYAESLMNLNAWKLWSPDGKPAPGTEEIVATLKGVLARDPNHAGANHYYVHAVEASAHPEDGVVAAQRLRVLAPAAGHLVHMPAHIMWRIGSYEDAAEANRQGAAADLAYAARAQPPDYYPVMYTAHNYQFLAYATAMEGRRAETIAAVDDSRKSVTDAMLEAMPGTDWYVAESYAGRVRFGLWAELLALPEPAPQLTALHSGYLYGRGLAQAATGQLAEARTTLQQLRAIAASPHAQVPTGMNTLGDVLAIAIPIIEARIATAEHRSADAVRLLREAVAREDGLSYNEPRDWFFPVRQLLGAELLRSGAAAAAEQVYREDLARNPANGWSLFGLSEALGAQGKTAAAGQARRDFTKAWQRADVQLTASAF